ncbi:MAG: helix-turn-helix domain-containing protein [Ilumatobacteraceae bacterium]
MDTPPPIDLSATDLAVLGVLVRAQGKVLSRAAILRLAGLRHLAERRCDTCIVAIRRVLGAQSVVTVRGRGWRISDDSVDAAAELLVGHANPAD